MKDLCCIFAAGEYPSIPELPSGAFIIAADGGEEILEKIGIRADLSIGDFDSFPKEPKGKRVIRFPVKKDDTDTMLAVKEGLSLGYKKFIIYGSMGGRLDHTIANLQTLSYIAENGAVGYLISGGCGAAAIKDGALIFKKPCGFSLFALSGDATVSIKGAEYSGENIRLTPHFPLGVSNKISEKGTAEVLSGTLHIIWECEDNALSAIEY